MDKFNLNQSLRIYIPGLLFSFLTYFILYENMSKIEFLLIPAIFVSIIFDLIFGKSHKKTFRNIVAKADFEKHWGMILLKKIKIYNINFAKLERIKNGHNYKMYEFVGFSYFSKKYNNTELAYFRYPKSLGVMYFNLFIVCSFCIIISIIKLIYQSMFKVFFDGSQSGITIIILFILVFIFYFGSKISFNNSLQRELSYWRSIDKAELNEILDITKLWISNEEEKNSTNTQQWL
ncbi:hypothetical protein [Thalassobellus citreus]|uniref:hypothetical protein n=1 Tax=Thalassobellus citreus TaxID=3367752 RepID=UPI0037ADDF50